jgi:hypothetical protein
MRLTKAGEAAFEASRGVERAVREPPSAPDEDCGLVGDLLLADIGRIFGLLASRPSRSSCRTASLR